MDHTVFKKIRMKEMKSIKLGETREVIKNDAIIESVYDPEGEKRLKQLEDDAEKKTSKGLIRVFGYKHIKSMKFFA